MADDVRAWLDAQGLGRYADAFEANDIDADLLRGLTDADLVAMGVASLGHRKKLLAAIGGAPAPAPAVASQEPPTRALSKQRELGIWKELEARGYVIEHPLGAGGMGEVYVARQAGVDRQVAIKVLRVSDEPDAAVRFAREARAIAALQHPHTVRLYDYVAAGDGGSAIVMELVEGESMWQLLQRERRLRVARVVPLIMQVCDALGEAHGKGIVHRDLKPANILLQAVEGYQDFARVLDFGLARWLHAAESRLTRTGHVFGTPQYLSPEQIQGGDVGPAADLYALGVILHEALAGEPPFGAEGDASMMFRHVTEVAPPLPADVERPAAIDRVLERLLAKAPALRPPSARALRDELATALAGPIEVRTPSAVVPAPSVERRRLVVVDVRSPDEDAAGDDRAHDRLRARHAIIERARRRHGGYLAARDGAHAQLVFGAPVARRDDVRRALRAALELRTSLGAPVRIGVADGLGIAGTAEDGYLVSGPPLAHAARLAAAAADGEIAVARDLVDRAGPGLRWGDAAAGDARALIEQHEEDSQPVAHPFVGRERELGELTAIVQASAAPGSRPTGRIVVIAGEAGIGKSRLLERLAARARGLGARVASGAVVDVEVGRDESALHQLVGAVLDLPSGGGSRAEHDDRLAALEHGGHGLRAEQWPFLYHFLGVPLPGPMQRLYDAMEPATRLAGYRDMLASLLAAERRDHPVVLVIEDVHWADPPTLDGVATLCGIARGQPIVLILTTRVEGEERWRHVLAGHPVHRIELEPLRPEEARELAARLGADDDKRAAMVARAAGHPLLLTELARGADGDDSLPHSIQGLVHGRVDRLPDRDRAAIQIASVLGPWFKLAHLREMLGDPTYGPAMLLDYRLLGPIGDDELRFTHALVRDAVYDALVADRRRALHERAAALFADDLAVAAGHLDRAGSVKAPAAFLRAALKEAAGDHDDRARHLAIRGLALATKPEDRLPLLALRGDMELELGDTAASIAAYDEMAALAADDRDAYRAGVGQAAGLRIAGRYADALAALDRAEGFAQRGGVPSARLHYLRGSVSFAIGRLDDCRAAHERSLALARESGDDASIVLRTADAVLRAPEKPGLAVAHALSGLGDAHYGAGRMVSAARTYQECIELCRDAFLLGVEVTNLPMLAMAKVFVGAPQEAAALAAEAVARASRLSRRRAEALARGAASFAALTLGDHATALTQADTAREISKQLGTAVFEQAGHYYAAQAHLGLGDRAAARREVDAGLALARKHGMHFIGAALLATLARIDPAQLVDALTEGDTIVGAAPLAFNRFWFHDNAIAAALAVEDRETARRHADALLAATAAEPVPWAEAVAARV